MNDNVNVSSLVATSVTAQAFGAALAVVYLAYHHIPDTNNGVDVKMLEDALTVIFSTSASIVAMLVHLLMVKLFQSKTQ